MFSLSDRPRRVPASPRHVRPCLEALEDRALPSATHLPYVIYDAAKPAWQTHSRGGQVRHFDGSAPVITLSVTYLTQRNVTLSGTVTDANPAGLTVTFTGEVTGNTTTDASGNYSFTAPASALGNVNASTVDLQGLQSNTATVALSVPAPKILNFKGAQGPSNVWTFSGTVQDVSPVGETVYFGGAPVSIQNKTTTVASNATFLLSVQFNGTSSDNGAVDAYVVNWWGLSSPLVYTSVQQSDGGGGS